MLLRSLTSQNFRNLAPVEIPFHPTVNVVVGRNGQGKTNLLEAIHFLATTKSFRTSRIASVIRFDQPSVFVTGSIERDGLIRTQSIGLEAGETRRRLLTLNGEKVPLTAYLSGINLFAYSQSRLEILHGAPDERRRFLDRGISSINAGYLDDLTRYLRVLKQRNALLHAIASGQSTSATLDAWNDEFIVAAAIIYRARREYAHSLGLALGEVIREHRYHVDDIEILYRGAGDETELRANVERLRRHELRGRMSLLGPQRDIIEFRVAGRPAHDVLSGGEQKMVVLFLKFAKIELFRRRFDEPPLFLLDDVDAELDLEVLERLLGKLPPRTQVFATSAKESFLQALEAGPHCRLTIENGTVTSHREFV